MTTTVTGNPELMRARAAQLRQRADQLGLCLVNLEHRVATMTYAGPAADRFRSDFAGAMACLRFSREQSISLADLLTRQAAHVDEQRRLEALRGN